MALEIPPRFIFCAAIAAILLSLPCVPSYADDPVQIGKQAAAILAGGDDEKAVDLLRKGCESFPYNEALKKDLAAAYRISGERLLEKGRVAQAGERFDQAITLFPDEPSLRFLRGVAYYRLKEYDAAKVELELARGGTDNPRVLFVLGLVHYDSAETSSAVELWEKALLQEPGNVDIQRHLEKARRELAVEAQMEKEGNGAFIVSYDAGKGSEFADKVLDTLIEFYNRVGYELGRYPSHRVPVMLYTGKGYRTATRAPDWSAGLYDGIIRIPIGGLTKMTPEIRGLLRHEYTHALIHDITGGRCPVWMNEGLAVLQERVEFHQPFRRLPEAVRSHRLLSFEKLAGPFTALPSSDVLLAYEQSCSLVGFMLKRYGQHKVVDILEELGRGETAEGAVSKVFSDYGLDMAAIVAEWQTAVTKEYGE